MTTPDKIKSPSHSSVSMQFGVVALARTQHERYSAAWRAAKSYLSEAKNSDGWPLEYRCYLLTYCHGKIGPKHLRMSRLDAWRVTLDAMHSQRGAA